MFINYRMATKKGASNGRMILLLAAIPAHRHLLC